MFCTNCGNKMDSDSNHCTNCGVSVVRTETVVSNYSEQKVVTNGKWWHRLGVVIYIFFNLLLIPVVFTVWDESSTTYVSNGTYGYHYEDSYGLAFWYSLLTIVVWLLVLRLIKSALQYIVLGKKFQFKDLLFF